MPRISVRQQLLSQAPDKAVGYRLKGTSGPKGGAPPCYPKPTEEQPQLTSWLLQPFQAPVQCGEGRYRVEWVDAEGREVLARDPQIPPAVDVWWHDPDEDPPNDAQRPRPSPQDVDEVVRIRQAYQTREAELDRLKAEVEHLTSESSELAKMRTLVSASAQKEMATAQAAVDREMALAKAASDLALAQMQTAVALGQCVQQNAELLKQPAPPRPGPDLTKLGTRAMKLVEKVSVALVNRNFGGALKALQAPLPSDDDEDDDDDGGAGGSGPAAAAARPPDVVETPAPAASEAAQAFGDLAQRLSAEELERLVAAMKDPARQEEFLGRIRPLTTDGGPSEKA